jgi:hypothetical protein
LDPRGIPAGPEVQFQPARPGSQPARVVKIVKNNFFCPAQLDSSAVLTVQRIRPRNWRMQQRKRRRQRGRRQHTSEEAQVSLRGSTSTAALSVPCLLLCVYVYEADATVMLEVAPQDFVINSLKVWYWCLKKTVIQLEVTRTAAAGGPIFCFVVLLKFTCDCSEVC